MTFVANFGPETSAWVVESLAHILWQGALAAGLAAVIAYALRKSSAESRYCVHCLAILLTAACLPINLWLLTPTNPMETAAFSSTAVFDSDVPTLAPAAIEGLQPDVDETQIAVEAAMIDRQAAKEFGEPLNGAGGHAWQWVSQWIVVAYIVGIAAMVVRLMLGLYGSQRLRTTAQPIEEARMEQVLARIVGRLRLEVLPLIAYSARVTTPLVVGVVKPAILLPAAILNELTSEQVEAILLHELAHIRRYDHWVNLIQRIIEAVLFFHPAVWWLSHKVSLEREHCCDDLAIRWGTEPCDYAESLVRLSEVRHRWGLATSSNEATLAVTGNRPNQLRGRVMRVLGMSQPGPNVGLTRGGITSFIVIGVLLLVGTLQWPSQAQSEGEDFQLPKSTPADRADEQEVGADTPATVSGKIVLEDGSPATVKGWLYYDLRYPNGNGASGTEGHYADEFSFQVGPGTAWLSHYVEGYAPVWTDKLELAAGEIRDDIVLVLKPGVSQRVQVVNQRGEPVPNASLVAHPRIHKQTGGPVHKQQTDNRGEYLFQHLANVKYSLNVEAAGYEPTRGQLYDLQPEETIKLELSDAAKTSGVVLQKTDRKPLAGAAIRLVHEANQTGPNRRFSDSRKYAWWGEQYATTDENGRFTLDRLAHGSRYLAVIETADGARAIFHGLEAGQSLEILVPQRRDLVVNLAGDLSQLKKGSWKPRVNARQRFRFKPWSKNTIGELLGAAIVIEPVPGGGKAVLQGLAVDLNASLEQQEVEVYLPGNQGYSQTVSINPNGDTVVQIKLPAAAAARAPTTSEKAGAMEAPLRCRLVAVAPDSNDESPGSARQTSKYSSGDNLAFVVELTNTGDKPFTLLGTGYGDSYAKSSGKPKTKGYGERLFEFEFFDTQGKPLPRTKRYFVNDAPYLSGASTQQLKPGESRSVLLRPTGFDAPMAHRLPSGSFGARVTYRGASKDVLTFARRHRPDQPVVNAWSGDAISNTVGFAVENPTPRLDPEKLVWGPVKDGLQAAIAFKATKGVRGDPLRAPGVLVGSGIGVVFHVKNASDRVITFASETGRMGDSVEVLDIVGEKVEVPTIWQTGWPIDVRWILNPGEVAALDVISPTVSGLKHPGVYSVKYTIRLNSRQLKDKQGDIVLPRPGDWQDTLETGVAQLFLRLK